jgi:uncharacterized protein YpmS
VVIPVIFVLLVLYKPAGIRPDKLITDKQVSLYLTNVLYPQLYNGAQRQEPFELVITEEGINDIISRLNWPIESDGIWYFTPKALFKPKHIILSGIAATRGVELAITIAGSPAIDKKGLLNLNITKVKVGAVNMTIPAKIIASRVYASKINPETTDANDIKVKIAASLVNNEPFEPVFKIKGQKIRIEKIDINNKQLTINFVPALPAFRLDTAIKQLFIKP